MANPFGEVLIGIQEGPTFSAHFGPTAGPSRTELPTRSVAATNQRCG